MAGSHEFCRGIRHWPHGGYGRFPRFWWARFGSSADGDDFDGLGRLFFLRHGVYVEEARQPLDSLEVHIEASRVDSVPAVFESIHLRFVVKGEGMSLKQVRRAADLSIEKYCSVSKMLEKTATITHSLEFNGEEVSADSEL